MARLLARLTLFRVQSVKCQPGKLLNLTLFDVIDGLIFPIQPGRLARLHSMIPVHRDNHLQHSRVRNAAYELPAWHYLANCIFQSNAALHHPQGRYTIIKKVHFPA